jgi:hypothetical protein
MVMWKGCGQEYCQSARIDHDQLKVLSLCVV